MKVMDFSPQQSHALDAVARWYREKASPFFYVGGFAGTGKTTLAKHFAAGVNGKVFFASYTGKAASVMRAKGCWGARTIHSLIYKPREKGVQRLLDLEDELKRLLDEIGGNGTTSQIQRLKEEIAAEKAHVKQPHFELNLDSELADAALLVIDEGSMVGGQMVDDLFYFRVPILFLGDPAQLPPVKAAGFFTRNEPDYCLTEIHRQALDNPIIRMSMDVREGRSLHYGPYGDSSVITIDEFRDRRRELCDGAQVIVGKNETRKRANLRAREERGLGKKNGVFPEAGDRLVCLKNNRDIGLWNGTIWDVLTAADRPEDGVEWRYMNIRGEDGLELVVDVFDAPFKGLDIPHWLRREAEEFDFGYALTCHKSQGSQWDDVVLIDESRCFRQDAAKWLYTGVTRAARKVTIVR